MNSKGIKALKNTDVCMKCLQNKATHIYQIVGRGYGSIFDMERTKFQCCDECNRPEYKEWFNESPNYDGYIEEYDYEYKIWDLIKNLPLESRELFENRFNIANWMDAQDWIDYELNELPYEKCKEYGLIAPQDIKKFTTNDNSKSSQSPFGVDEKYGQKINKNGSVSCECTNCKCCELREHKTMDNIKELFSNMDCEFDESEVGVLYITTDDIIYLVVNNDEEPYNKWLLRVSTKMGFDRWANSCPIEKRFETKYELCKYLKNNELDIYKKLLSYLSKEYGELEKVFHRVVR